MTKQKWVAFAVASVLGTTAIVATAGYKQSNEVFVGSNYAYGALGSARASADSNQYIGCQSYGTYGWCAAANSSGTAKSCYFTSAQHAAAVHSIGPQSLVYFDVDGSGNCQYIYVSNYSFYLPSTP